MVLRASTAETAYRSRDGTKTKTDRRGGQVWTRSLGGRGDEKGRGEGRERGRGERGDGKREAEVEKYREERERTREVEKNRIHKWRWGG